MNRQSCILYFEPASFDIDTLWEYQQMMDGLIGDLSNQESSNMATNRCFKRNRIKTGSISFTNCKQLVRKMFSRFHTVLNYSIISCTH